MVVYYILLPIGLVLLIISLGVGTYQHLSISRGTITEGTVVGNVHQGRGYAPKIEIHTKQGKDIFFSPSFSSNPPIYSQGDKVRVVYHDDGQDARILSFGTRFGLPWVFLCVGIAMIVIAFGFKYGEAFVNHFYASAALPFLR
jgi:hypothetical protein